MEQKETENLGCPLQSSKVLLSIADALDAINGKWRIKIIAVLLDGPKRFKDISLLVAGITDRMLSIELKKLEGNLLVEKKWVGYTDQAEYELSDHGKSLRPLVMELIEWGGLHRTKVIENLY